MKALVLKKPGEIELADVADPGRPGPNHVRVRVAAVGICGSDMHYYLDGRIGDFVVERPMILGHEASGWIDAIGEGVDGLALGDLVALEPGLPCGRCPVCRVGRYNLCRDVRFWATPPIDGALAEYVVHPAAFTHRLPASMTPAAGALMEPTAVAVHACRRAAVGPGDIVAVAGAGPVGLLTMLVATASGATGAVISDVISARTERAGALGALATVDASSASVADTVMAATAGVGAQVGFECSGDPRAARNLITAAARGGKVVLVGMGEQPVDLDTVAAMTKEVDILTVFRYANAFPAAIALASGGRMDPAQIVTDSFGFGDAIRAFEYLRSPRPETCKVIIEF